MVLATLYQCPKNKSKNGGRNLIIYFNIYFLGKIKPFRVGVHFDEDEVCSAFAANTCEWDITASTKPGGITGFKLYYWQTAC